MTGLQLGCARADCCQRLPPSEEDDLEAVAGPVVRDMATLNVEDLPVEGADPYGVRAYSDNLATAIAKALQEALPEPDHECSCLLAHLHHHGQLLGGQIPGREKL